MNPNNQLLYNSVGTILEMLYDRGYDMSGINKDDIYTSLTNKNNHTISIITGEKVIDVIYYLPFKFKLAEARAVININPKADLTIIVLNDKLSANNTKSVLELGKNINIFEIKELQFNITKHILVPKHEIIREEEIIADVVLRYNIKTKFQLPHILKTDPMSRYLGLKTGDMVKIIRTSPSAGEYIGYRVCL
jgi:DNA-directed RNA polymerase I, II, and III subunit RPABC1